MLRLPILFILLSFLSVSASAHEDLDSYYHMNSSEIIALFGGNTMHSFNASTKTAIITYLGQDGNVKQSILTSKIQRKGKWHAANGQLCLKWWNKGSEYCFDRVIYHDNVVLLIKNDEIQSIVNEKFEGDKTGF